MLETDLKIEGNKNTQQGTEDVQRDVCIQNLSSLSREDSIRSKTQSLVDYIYFKVEMKPLKSNTGWVRHY